MSDELSHKIYLIWDCKNKQILCDNDDNVYCFINPKKAKEISDKIKTNHLIIVIRGELKHG